MMLVALLLHVVVAVSSAQDDVDNLPINLVTPSGDVDEPYLLNTSNETLESDLLPTTSVEPTLTSSDNHQNENKEISPVIPKEETDQSPRQTEDFMWDIIGFPKRRAHKIFIPPWATMPPETSPLSSSDNQKTNQELFSKYVTESTTYPTTTEKNEDYNVVPSKIPTIHSKENELSNITLDSNSTDTSTDLSLGYTSTELIGLMSPNLSATVADLDPSKDLNHLPSSQDPQMALLHHEDEMYHPIEFDPNNPYSHWDSDSEEQEREMELQRLQDEPENPEETNITLQLSTNYELQPKDSSSPSPLSGRSYLLLLAGNSTIVKLRQRDFAKYLKLNLAARLSLEYDDVRVNRVVLAPPRLLVNVSVVSPSETVSDNTAEEERIEDTILKEEAPLHMLAETNATLLELSGEEYHVVRLLPLRSNPPNKETEEYEDNLDTPSTMISDRHADIELVIYTAVGGACAVVILATLLITFGKYLRMTEIPWPWKKTKQISTAWNLPNSRLRHQRMGEELPVANGPPPTVIYSGSFAARAAAAAASGASWVDDYQPQPNNIVAEDPVLGVKLMANNPMYADLEMGDNMIMGSNTLFTDVETTCIINPNRHGPNSKLHIFSCRPGSLLLPMPPQHAHRKNLVPPKMRSLPSNQKKSLDSQQLDVRIGNDRHGHDNPNYQT